MLNPEKYNTQITKHEKSLESIEKKKDEQMEIIKKAKKNNKKCFFSLLFIVALFGFIALAIFYAPLRDYCLALLKIDLNNISTTWDVAKFFIVLFAVIILELIAVAFAAGGEAVAAVVHISLMFAGTLFLPSGLYMIFVSISDNNRSKKDAKKMLKDIKKQIKKIQDNFNSVLEQKEEESKKLTETNEMFERGVAENNLQLLQKAADLGNPNAMLAEGKRLYEQVKQLEHTDKTLLEKAAKYGYPNAVFEIAEMWLDEATFGLFTKTEKSELLKKVDSYVNGVDFTNHPDGRMLQIFRQAYGTEKKDSYKLLEEVRSLKNEKRLSNKYEEVADIVIKQLVSEIDRLERNR